MTIRSASQQLYTSYNSYKHSESVANRQVMRNYIISSDRETKDDVLDGAEAHAHTFMLVECSLKRICLHM